MAVCLMAAEKCSQVRIDGARARHCNLGLTVSDVVPIDTGKKAMLLKVINTMSTHAAP